jgi:hypothetical protein
MKSGKVIEPVKLPGTSTDWNFLMLVVEWASISGF